MNPHDSRILAVESSTSMDLFNKTYSTNTVGEHHTETRSMLLPITGSFSYYNQVISPKTKIPLMNPHDFRTLTVESSKSMDLFNMRYSTNTVREHPTETRSNTPDYNKVFFILKSSNFAKNKVSTYEPP